MAARRYEISLGVLKNISRASLVLYPVCFSLDVGRERRELRARRDWDETRTRQGVARTSSVFFFSSRSRPFYRPYHNYAFAFPASIKQW